MFEKITGSNDFLLISQKEFDKYAQVILDIRHRKSNTDEHYKHKFRMCTAKDFKKNGYNYISDKFENVIKARLCPDIPDEAPWYMVKNDYSNVTE